MCHYEKKKKEEREENLDNARNERDVRMSDTRMVIAYSPVRGIFKTRAADRKPSGRRTAAISIREASIESRNSLACWK